MTEDGEPKLDDIGNLNGVDREKMVRALLTHYYRVCTGSGVNIT
jgi:hypothetical protein